MSSFSPVLNHHGAAVESSYRPLMAPCRPWRLSDGFMSHRLLRMLRCALTGSHCAAGNGAVTALNCVFLLETTNSNKRRVLTSQSGGNKAASRHVCLKYSVERVPRRRLGSRFVPTRHPERRVIPSRDHNTELRFCRETERRHAARARRRHGGIKKSSVLCAAGLSFTAPGCSVKKPSS